MRIGRAAIAVAGGLSCLGVAGGAVGALAAATPAGGPIQVFVKPSNGQGNGKILITGAIGDYGAGHKVTSGGKTYSKLVLRRGTLEVDLTAISSKSNSVTPNVDMATCSASFYFTAPAPIVNGTGRYKGATGMVNLTESFGFIGPRYKSGPKKGQCNLSPTAAPAAQMGVVYGTGTVRF